MKKIISVLTLCVAIFMGSLLFGGCSNIKNEDILAVLPNARGSYKEIGQEYKDSLFNVNGGVSSSNSKPVSTDGYFEKAWKLKDGTIIVRCEIENDVAFIMAYKNGIILNSKFINLDTTTNRTMKFEAMQAKLDSLKGKKLDVYAKSNTNGTGASKEFFDAAAFSDNDMYMINTPYFFNRYLSMSNVKIDESFTADAQSNYTIKSYIKENNKKFVVAEAVGGSRAYSLVYVETYDVLEEGVIVTKISYAQLLKFVPTGNVTNNYHITDDDINLILAQYNGAVYTNASGANPSPVAGATQSANSIINAINGAKNYTPLPEGA